MNTIYLLCAFLITGVALFALKPVAVKVGLVDIPGGRKTHIKATPLVGGLGIFFGVVVMTIFTPGAWVEFGPFLSLAALVLFIGTVDDAKELTVAARMTGHALIAVVMAVVAGVQLNSLGDIAGMGNINLGALAIPVTIFATIGVINAINMSDGIDGLSGGLVIVTLGFIGWFSFASGNVLKASFLGMIVCSILAFLTLNFRRPWHRRALIYLGDAGSTMLGFMLAWLLIESSQGESAVFSPVYALWFMAIPLFDTVSLLIRRPLAGISPFRPGTDHLHHNLLRLGFSVESIVVILTSSAVLFGLVGFVGFYRGATDAFMFQLFLCTFGFYFFISNRLAASVRPEQL